MKSILALLFTSLLSITASASVKCEAFCLDVRAEKNPLTKQVENQFNRSPRIKAASFQGLVSKCQRNFGTALLTGYKSQRTFNASSKLIAFKSAKPQTACKPI